MVDDSVNELSTQPVIAAVNVGEDFRSRFHIVADNRLHRSLFRVSENATAHLSSDSGESSMIVPTLTVNCLFGCLFLHSQRRYLARNFTFTSPQCGQQICPCGQRIFTRKSWVMSASEKYRMASISV